MGCHPLFDIRWAGVRAHTLPMADMYPTMPPLLHRSASATQTLRLTRTLLRWSTPPTLLALGSWRWWPRRRWVVLRGVVWHWGPEGTCFQRWGGFVWDWGCFEWDEGCRACCTVPPVLESSANISVLMIAERHQGHHAPALQPHAGRLGECRARGSHPEPDAGALHARLQPTLR